MKTKVVWCLTIAALLLSCAKPNKDDKLSGITELDEWAQNISQRKTDVLGYPCNENIELDAFYRWYTANKLDGCALNNVGDPFSGATVLMLSAAKFEREVIEFFAPLYGIDKEQVWGIVTNSGTDGNNHGMYFGANYLRKLTGQLPVVYVSDEAHYSNARLADLQHLELRLVKSDRMGRMIPEELEKNLDPSRPALIVYALGSTFRGAIDDIEALNAVLDKYPEMKVYRHVDAALFGGYLPFTQYRDMVNCSKLNCQSISVSGHKFFGMDEPAGIFLTTKEVYTNQSQFDIAYLNENMKMINCSRSATDVLKFYWLIKHVGEERWKADAAGMLEHTAYMKKKLDEIGWPCWLNEYSNTIFFRRPSQEVVDYFNLACSYDEQFGGELAHVVVMQHVTEPVIDAFVERLKAEK